MLNALPLPIGPTETPSASAKSEIKRKAPDSGATGENDTSFASTLEAVHKNNPTPGHGVKQKCEDTSDTQSASEDKSVTDETEDCIVSADGVFKLMVPEQGIPNKDLGYKMSTKNFDANTASEATPPAPETELMSETAEFQKKTVVTPHRNMPDLVVPRQSIATNSDAPGGVNGNEAAQDTLLQEDAKAFKSVKEAVEAVKANTGAQVSPNAVAQSHQASQAMEGEPDSKIAQKTQRNALDGLIEKTAKVDATVVQPVIDEGETQLSNKDNSTPHLRHKGTENQKTASETPTPGKIKAEVLDFQTVRSPTAEDSTEGSKTFGAKVSETPIPIMNDEASPMAGRQGALDQALSFSTSPAGGKVAMASSHATTAPVAATDIFHQDNFHQLVERALFTVRGEHSEARIALKPDHLGHVQLKIVTENNLVTIKIITETPVARDLIDANANQLKTELQQQGLNVGNIEVSVSDERHDAYRQARQRESFLRKAASQKYASPEEYGENFENGPSQIKPNRSSVAGIDYFA